MKDATLTLKDVTVDGGDTPEQAKTEVKSGADLTIKVEGTSSLGKLVVNSGASVILDKAEGATLEGTSVSNDGTFRDSTATIPTVTGDGALSISGTLSGGGSFTTNTPVTLTASTTDRAGTTTFIWQKREADGSYKEVRKQAYKEDSPPIQTRSGSAATDNGIVDTYSPSTSATGISEYRCLIERTVTIPAGDGNTEATTATTLLSTQPAKVEVWSDSDPEPVTSYTVTLPALEGFSISPAPGQHSVEEGYDFSFTLTPAEGNDTPAPTVTTSRGETLTPRPSDGLYVITGIYEDITVRFTSLPTANDAANVTVMDEVIGGTYLRQTVQDTDKDSFVSATVGSTNLILKAGTFKSNVIAGGKSNDNTGSLSSDVLGDTSLTITGGTYEAAVLGGGSAKAGQGKDVSTKRDVSADVKGTARVNVTGGTLNGIVGGGLSYLYTSAALTDAVVTTHVENVAANITGGTINTMDHNSGLDDFGIPASVVGGGVAYSKSTVTTNKVEATVGNVDMTIAGKGVKLSGDIYAGGFAHGAKTAASVNSTRLTIADATLGAADSQVNVFAGGYAAQGATSTVKTSEVTIANSKIFGNVYGGGNKADAQSNVTVESSVITLDGADVTGTVSTESFEPSVNAALMRLAEADTGAGDAEANKTQRTINLINSKMGTLQISAKQDTETSLYLEGSNTVGAITGGKASEIVFDGTGTPAGEAILTLTKEGASFDMSGDKDIVARNVASGTLLVDGKYKTAAETTVTLENAFGDVVYDLGKDAIDSADLLLTDAGIVIGTGDTAQTIGASSVKVSESSKTLAEAQLGSVAFVTQGAEFVADEGMRSIRAAAKEGSFTAFGAMAGGYNRYETGSHVDVEGFSLAVGTAGRINNLTLAGFVEAGWASSESHVASTEADADHDYYGVGAAMRYDFQSPFYLDGAVRLGQISTEFDGSYGTGTAKYDADGLYATAHIGAGYVFDLTPDVKLDAYGRYLLSYVEGDDVTLESDAKERFSMDDTTTHAVRLGARLEGAFQTFDWYAGLAYEHVFDGKAEGELKFAGATAALDAPSLKGDSAIVDLSFTMKPEANGPWTIGVGLKGYAGDRRGGTGSVNVLYTF